MDGFDREGTTRELQARGVTPEPVNIDFGFHIKDPDGAIVQLVEARSCRSNNLPAGLRESGFCGTGQARGFTRSGSSETGSHRFGQQWFGPHALFTS